MHRSMIIVVMTLTLTACTTTGNGKMKTLTQESNAQEIMLGKTKAEIASKLGEAHTMQFDNGEEIWVYEYAESIPKFVDFLPVVGLVTSRIEKKGRELRILFDANGVVRKTLLLESTRL